MNEEQIFNLGQTIMLAIMDGLSARRPVLYRVYRKEHDEARNRDEYRWSKEELEGKLIEFIHYNDEEIESSALIEQKEGTIVQIPISKVRFNDGNF